MKPVPSAPQPLKHWRGEMGGGDVGGDEAAILSTHLCMVPAAGGREDRKFPDRLISVSEDMSHSATGNSHSLLLDRVRLRSLQNLERGEEKGEQRGERGRYSSRERERERRGRKRQIERRGNGMRDIQWQRDGVKGDSI